MFDRLIIDFQMDTPTGLPTPIPAIKGSKLRAVKVSIDTGKTS